MIYEERKKCVTACYDCPSFSDVYEKIKIENCVKCKTIAKAESVSNKIRNNVPAAYSPKLINQIEKPDPIKHQPFEYTDWHFQQFAVELGFKTEVEMRTVLHVEKKMSAYKLKDLIRNTKGNNFKISDLTIRKRLSKIGVYIKSSIGRQGIGRPRKATV